LTPHPNHFYRYVVPSHSEGRFAIVTDVGGGMRWTRGGALTRCCILRTAKSCGPDASVVGVKLAEATPPMTVSKKPDHRGEHEGNRKTIARGMPGDSGVTVVTTTGVAVFFCPPGCGRIGRPAFPAPSLSRVRSFQQTSRENTRRECGVVPSLRGAKRRSNPYLLCGIMDCFASLAMTFQLSSRPPSRDP